MKHIFRKISTFILTSAVLFSITSFTTDMHFCGNKLVDVAIFGKAKPCQDKKQHIETPSKECSIGQKSCCSNQSFVKSGDDNLRKAQWESGVDDINFLQTFFYTYINLFEGHELKTVPFINYDPPWIEKHIRVLHETFLI